MLDRQQEIQAIVDAIALNQEQSLDLTRRKISVDDIEKIARVLAKNTCLQRFYLGYNQLGDGGVRFIAEALKQNATLTMLDLSWNRLRDADSQVIAEALTQNTTLRVLNLGGNQLGVAGAQAVAEVFKYNTVLRALNLESNHLGDAGTQALVAALRHNTTLRMLNLSWNQLEVAGAKALAKFLKQNRALRELYLAHNWLSETDAQAIIEALNENYTLLRLDWDFLPDLTKVILARNQAIYDCISSIKHRLSKGSVEMSHISEALQTLESLIPGIGTEQSPPDDAHPIAEHYRLWSGIGHVTQSASFEEGFALLSHPFQHPDLQQAADRARAHALLITTRFDHTEVETQAARHRLILYFLRHRLQEPTAQSELKAALVGLKHPDKAATMGEKEASLQTLVGADALLSYEDVLRLAEKSLQIASNADEIAYLKRFLDQKTYDPMTCEGFWQSESFRQQLQQDYPRSKSFRVLENYLLHPMASDTNTLTQFDGVRVFGISTFDATQDGTNKVDAQSSSAKTFDMPAYLAEQQQIIMTTLSEALLLNSKSFVAATTAALHQFSTGRDELELTLKTIKYGVLSFLDVRSQPRYRLSDYAVFYQKLFNHNKTDPALLLVIALVIVQSDLPILEPLQAQIAEHSFPDRDDGLALFKKSAAVLLTTLTPAQMELMSALSALKPLDFEKAEQIIDKPAKDLRH